MICLVPQSSLWEPSHDDRSEQERSYHVCTPREIAPSGNIAATLAKRIGSSQATVYMRNKRRRLLPLQRLQTIFTPAQERVVVWLRRTLLQPLDDPLSDTR